MWQAEVSCRTSEAIAVSMLRSLLSAGLQKPLVSYLLSQPNLPKVMNLCDAFGHGGCIGPPHAQTLSD